MAKFFFFEYIVSLFYKHVFTKPKDQYGKPTQLGVTFASGYLAGVVCAVVSHPADSVVSLMGKPANKGKSIGQIASEVGIVSLATKGLGTRIIMIGTLTGTCMVVQLCPFLFLTHMCLCRLPVVDLRFIQDRDGHGYDWWQVNLSRLYHLVWMITIEMLGVEYVEDVCAWLCCRSLRFTISLSQLVPFCRFTVEFIKDTYPVCAA